MVVSANDFFVRIYLQFYKKEISMEDLKHSETWRVFRIQSELVEGFETLNGLGPAVAIFGSSRMKPGAHYYDKAAELGKRLSDAGFAVITGGGPGVMEGANKGPKRERQIGWSQYRNTCRTTPEPVSGHLPILQIFLYKKTHVRKIFERIHYIPRRFRHHG